MTNYKSTLIKLITPILLFTSIASAELSKDCNKSISALVSLDGSNNDALLLEASKITVQVCIKTLENGSDADVDIIKKIYEIGIMAENRIIRSTKVIQK